jgi:hypothetical protein
MKEQGCEELIERSKKSDEELRENAVRLEALLIRCNFSQNFASYIAECSGSRVHYTN